MEEFKRLWGRNIAHGRAALNAEGGLRSGDEPPMSQARLAELLGVTQQTVSDWERGVNAPRDDLKVEIAGVLHQDVWQLFPLVRNVPSKRSRRAS